MTLGGDQPLAKVQHHQWNDNSGNGKTNLALSHDLM